MCGGSTIWEFPFGAVSAGCAAMPQSGTADVWGQSVCINSLYSSSIMSSMPQKRHVAQQIQDNVSDASYPPAEPRMSKSRRRRRKLEDDVFGQRRGKFLTVLILGASCTTFLGISVSLSRSDSTDSHTQPLEGDTTRRYFKLRQEYDALLPYSNAMHLSRIKNVVQSLATYTSQTIDPVSLDFDIYNCPLFPPPDYPISWNVMKVLNHWGPEDIHPPKVVLSSNQTAILIYQSLCVFDYKTQLEAASNYRNLEVPLIIRNDPTVYRTVERWSQPDYLSKLMGQTKYPVEYSSNNHFLYWDKKKAQNIISEETTSNTTLLLRRKEWEPPTNEVHMTYDEWISHTHQTTVKGQYYYLRLIGCGIGLGRHCARPSAEFLFNELPFFSRNTYNSTASFYLVEPMEQKGIHCRFAMPGIISESHFDDSRNFIALLAGGSRRYILAHPNQCENLHLYPKDHPSARQSSVNWSNPDLNLHPKFSHVMVNEVVLNPGDVLYLPTSWFHFIVSLDINIQCNTRSGRTQTYDKDIEACD